MDTLKTISEQKSFRESQDFKARMNHIIPGGGHTYAKGDDQFSEFYAPYIVRGKGCHVWDMDGNEYIEYAMGLRAVTLGHAYEPVNRAVIEQMNQGTIFNRPSPIELYCAELLLDTVNNGHEMVKFGKNGSDVTTAAIKLARAFTGREMIAVCKSHPFFSVDDWFIGSTAMDGGIPQSTKDLTVHFFYNDPESLAQLFNQYPGKIAAVILEPEKDTPPKDHFLHKIKDLCNQNGTVFILDEIISGFRYHIGGCQKIYGIQPDLTTYGKALANGFSIAALLGKREIMQLGGLDHDKERVFLLSNTFGSENHHLAAAIATMNIYREEKVIEYLYDAGDALRAGLEKVINELNLNGYFGLFGKSCCIMYGTKDQEMKPSQPFRTLFLQETIKRGLLMPSLIVSYSHTPKDIEYTIDNIHQALVIYRKALDEGVDKYLEGKPVKPVFRKFN
jgi:glutamate-1-semialdehyde 2,1-aminomutase